MGNQRSAYLPAISGLSLGAGILSCVSPDRATVLLYAMQTSEASRSLIAPGVAAGLVFEIGPHIPKDKESLHG